MYKLSLCIATNGVVEWVSKVLESIYKQNVDEDLFEVVITDNGNNDSFIKLIDSYKENHKNINYKKTNSKGFMNIIDSFDIANGVFLKFINHRFEFLPGTIDYLLNFIDANISKKPYVYYTNGVLNKSNKIVENSNFNGFIYDLGINTSWSAGLSLWKDDFLKIPKNMYYDELFPNTSLLFYDLKKDSFIIDNNKLFEELHTTEEGKGVYDFFDTFAIRFVELIKKYYDNGRITKKTYRHIKSENLDWLSTTYYLFILKKSPCSYIIEGYKEKINKYYSMPSLILRLYKVYFRIGKDIVNKIFIK